MKNRNRLSYKDQIEGKIAERRQKTPPRKNKRRELLPQIDEGPRKPGQPLWMPESGDLEQMPVEVRQAVAEIVQPAY